MSNIITENRIGRVQVSEYLLRSGELGLFMCRIIPIRIDFHYHDKFFEYYCYSKYFRPVPEGALPPLYEATITEDAQGYRDIKFREVV